MNEDTTTPNTEVETIVSSEASPTALVAAKPTAVKKGKKNKRSVPHGQLHVNATFNNTIVTFTDRNGSVLTQSSAGACGFRGSKKGTAYAAQIAAEKAGAMAKQQYGMTKVDAIINGVGQGRETAVRALINLDIAVESMRDVTTIAHGGVRPKKARRN
jgi:small subunit ribosomal protein S11